MKILPCASCADGIARTGAQPYFCASFPGVPGRHLTYTCSACRKPRMLQAHEFHALPDASRADLERLGLLEHLSKDLTLGAEVEAEHAKDLFMAGFTPADLAAMPVQKRPKSKKPAPPPPPRRQRGVPGQRPGGER